MESKWGELEEVYKRGVISMNKNYEFGKGTILEDIEEVILMYSTMRVAIDFDPRIAEESEKIIESLHKVRKYIAESERSRTL